MQGLSWSMLRGLPLKIGALCTVLTVTAYFGIDEFTKYQQRQEIALRAESIVRHLLPDLSKRSFHEKVDSVRRFIRAHSTNDSAGEFVAFSGRTFYDYWKDYPFMLDSMIRHASKPMPKIELDCSTQSAIMTQILEQLGIEHRRVAVYRHAPNYPGHSFLEVFNYETDKWEVQDPHFDIFWRHIPTDMRASIEELVGSPYSDIEPCLSDGMCGWDIANEEGYKPRNIKPYLGLASVVDRKRRQRPLFVNEGRFPLAQATEIEGGSPLTYCEYRAKNCRESILRFRTRE